MKDKEILKINEIIYDSYLNWVGLELYTQKGEDFTGMIGLGERVQGNLFLEDGVYSSWA